MPDAALENGILKLIFKAAGGPDPALGRKGAAKHGATIGQFPICETAPNKFLDRQHAVERALLIEDALAADPGIGAQDHLVPVTDDVFEFPQLRRHHFVAHLLGHSYAVGLDLAVGVIGTKADE